MRAAMITAVSLLTLAGTARADDLKKSLAKRHFETGTQYYRTANYEAALEEFKKANQLFPLPTMLFNIGRCHEALGQLELAVENYEEYLRKKPDTPDRATLEERIRNIQRRIEAGKPAGEEQPAPAESRPPAPPPEETTTPAGLDGAPAADTGERGGGWTIAGWTAIGVGGAALAAAAILGGMALSRTGEYEEAHEQHKLYLDARETLDSAEALERGSFVALGVGLAAAAAGTLILVLRRDRPASATDDEEDVVWRIRPTGTGFAVQF